MDHRRTNCKPLSAPPGHQPRADAPGGAPGLDAEGLSRCMVCSSGSVMLYAFRPPEGYTGPPLPGGAGSDGVVYGLCSLCETAPDLFVISHLMRHLGVGARPSEGRGHAEGEVN
jgi:hypothetical protein